MTEKKAYPEYGQPPAPHWPDAQDEAAVGQAWHWGDGSRADTAKAEKPLTGLRAPHCGHVLGVSDAVLCNTSNSYPHFPHWYS